MEKVAFVTYNSVGKNLSSGWHNSYGRHALVLQNTKGEGSLTNGTPIGFTKRREQISELWNELQNSLEELDHIVVYVGAGGSERAIELAAQLPAQKVTFVACDCGLPKKEEAIQAAGMANAQKLLCECGGHRSMETLFENFMCSGELLPAT